MGANPYAIKDLNVLIPMHILITCPFGLSSLLAKEIKKLTAKSDTSFSIETTASTFLILQGDWQLVYQLNLWSRIANKVYLLL
ncbi:MAG: hypothetical protein LBP53_05675 [Candidatus Peribacteria bacterium]|nr:hypothetical protein [Candidatus Peribacteria bacterium]